MQATPSRLLPWQSGLRLLQCWLMLQCPHLESQRYQALRHLRVSGAVSVCWRLREYAVLLCLR